MGAGARREHGQRRSSPRPARCSSESRSSARRSTPTSSSRSSGVPEDDAFDHLDRALAALVVEPTSTGYRFRHGLVRDALLEDLPPHRRRRIHRDAAERLDRARRVGCAHRASPPRVGRSGRSRARTSSGRPRPMPRSARTATRSHWSTRCAPTPPGQPDDRPLAAGRPVERARRSDGRGGLPGGARRRRRRNRAPGPAGAAGSQLR